MDAEHVNEHEQHQAHSPRPRDPSPPPSGHRSREPPSPVLLAHSLPSTATLNALSRLSSFADVASIQYHADANPRDDSSPGSARTLTFSRAKFFLTQNRQDVEGEWIFLCGDVMTPARIREALQLDVDPPLEEVYWAGWGWTYKRCPLGRVLVDSAHPAACCIEGFAYGVQSPDDLNDLVEYFTQTCGFQWKVCDCDIHYRHAGEENLDTAFTKGKALVALLEGTTTKIDQ